MASTVVPTLQLNVVELVTGVTDDMSTENTESSVGIVSEVGGNVGDPQDEESGVWNRDYGEVIGDS